MSSIKTAVRLPPLPTIRDLVKLYRLKAIRKLSQNFLMDQNLTDKIVHAAGYIKNQYVCEVGPGPGGITRSILKYRPKKLIVVEKDPRFLPTLELLKEVTQETTEMEIHIDDIKNFNLKACFEGAPKYEWEDYSPPIHLIGNLPFSVSTNLIIRWLKAVSEKSGAWAYGRSTMTLTFQKEVGQRMVAMPITEQRCRLSVMCQLYCDVRYKFTIPGTAFVPKPEVDVAVVTLVPLKQPLVDMPFETVERITRTIFNTRQKYLKTCVGRLFPPDQRDELVVKLLVLADLDPTVRPYQLSNDEFVRIYYAYKALCEDFPHIEHYDFRAPSVNDVKC